MEAVAIRKFRITEDTRGVIFLSSKTRNGYLELRGGYEEDFKYSCGNGPQTRGNALLSDVRTMLAGEVPNRYRRGRHEVASVTIFSRRNGVILLANERGVFPDASFSDAARRALLNSNHVSGEEWSALRGFYSWDSWFAGLAVASAAQKNLTPPAPGRAECEIGARPLPNLSIAPVVFAEELWNGR